MGVPLACPGLDLCAGCALADVACEVFPRPPGSWCVEFRPADAAAREGVALTLAGLVREASDAKAGGRYWAALVGVLEARR